MSNGPGRPKLGVIRWQVVGRALRAAPGKTAARVIQVRESAVEYHFDQRWLRQDI